MPITLQGKSVVSIRPMQLAAVNDHNWSTFGTRPVFHLVCGDGTQRALKGEIIDENSNAQNASDNAALIGELQSLVGVNLDVSVLGAADVQALTGVTPAMMVHANPNCAAAYLSGLAGSGMFVFYTMTYIESLKTLEKQQVKQKDVDGMRQFGAVKLARKMRGDAQLLPALGRVVAVDLFCGNFDRFAANGDIVNVGNIMFQKDADKKYTPVGVDFFEAQGQFARMTAPLTAAQLLNWPGAILADAMRLDAFASRAVMGLNQAFQHGVSPHAMPADAILDATDVQAFRTGLSEGAEALRSYLLGLRHRGVASPGVQSRLDALGWTQTAWGGARAPQPRAGWVNAQPATRGLGPNRR
ncbi:hypothetical protein [Paraburkholderia acidisoli]|uniref:Uncharacterized protein n=1 Tax=Paraburkholderia acidisoli TaxID=2571748 RepID=A0A7Z2GPU4_9BURK|nr:hypothetical protein [Paraburkholderia acidisoli]QGZ65500.1 hypothetical protein FAZ98_27530 [Paraburkholderia acidisoli]